MGRHLPCLLTPRRTIVLPPPPPEPAPEQLLPDVDAGQLAGYEPVLTADDLHARARQALARFFDTDEDLVADVIARIT